MQTLRGGSVSQSSICESRDLRKTQICLVSQGHYRCRKFYDVVTKITFPEGLPITQNVLASALGLFQAHRLPWRTPKSKSNCLAHRCAHCTENGNRSQRQGPFNPPRPYLSLAAPSLVLFSWACLEVKPRIAENCTKEVNKVKLANRTSHQLFKSSKSTSGKGLREVLPCTILLAFCAVSIEPFLTS